MDTTSFCVTMVPGLNCAQLAKGGLSTISSGPGLADWAPTEHATPTIRVPAAATTRRNAMGTLLAADPLLRARFSCTAFPEVQQGETGRAPRFQDRRRADRLRSQKRRRGASSVPLSRASAARAGARET